MSTKRLILAITAAAIGAFAVSTSAVAADGETKTLTNNAFHEYASSICDFNAFTCLVSFTPTTNVTTLVKAVSCDIHVSFGSTLGFRFAPKASYETFFIPGSVFLAGNDLEVTANAPVYLFINKGDTPVVIATVQNGNFTSGGTMSCTIAGEHS